jgi:hypothetical protein
VNSIAALPRRISLPKLLVLLLLSCASVHLAIGQQTQSQPNTSHRLTPVSLPHLYWHFLIHQSVLDAAAAQVNVQGNDGNALRNDLQTRLGFSDADYAPIRTSSQRLAAELKPIDAQLKALPHTAASAGAVRVLIAQREAYIASEVYNLAQELSPENKAALEAFMTKFFQPRPLTVQPSSPASQPTGKAVTQ